MPPINIDLAERHAASLSRAYANVRIDAAVLRPFESLLASNARVTINSSFAGLAGFLRDGVFLNIHELVRQGKAPAGEAYRLRQDVERRLGFNVAGKKIVYGSLNTGNCGCRFFGDYCIVLRTDAVRNRVSFLQENSFAYFGHSYIGARNLGRVKMGSMATWSNHHELAVVKLNRQLSRQVRAYDVPAINALVCGYFNTIEAHVHGPVTLGDVEEVRIHHLTQSRADLFSRLANLDLDDRFFLQTHEGLVSALDRSKIRIDIKD